MVARGLADTGALLALVDRADRWHRPCAQILGSLGLPLATTAAVLAEVFYLLGARSLPVAPAFRLFEEVVAVLPITDADLPDIEALMEKYADRPMDFADATLVHLARREALTTVFTIDYDDFETYRIDGRRHFQIVPPRQSS